MSSSSSPCAACKFLRRKCTQECVFAPYFPADQPKRFVNVHKVFGASNVAKILNELHQDQREDAVNSLAYEADARLRDPVYGCVGLISILQHNLKQLQISIEQGKKELAIIVGPSSMMQMYQDPYLRSQFDPNINPAAGTLAASSSNPGLVPYNMAHMMGMMPGDPGSGPQNPWVITDPTQQQLQLQQQQQLQQEHIGGQLIVRDAGQQQQQLHGGHLMIRDAHMQDQQRHSVDAQQLATVMVREEQEIMRNFEQQQTHIHTQHHHVQQPELVRFEGISGGLGGGTGHFGHIDKASMSTPLLALGSGFDGNPYQIQQQQQQQQEEQPLLLLQQPVQPPEADPVQSIEHHQEPQVEQLFNEQPGSIHDQR